MVEIVARNDVGLESYAVLVIIQFKQLSLSSTLIWLSFQFPPSVDIQTCLALDCKAFLLDKIQRKFIKIQNEVKQMLSE